MSTSTVTPDLPMQRVHCPLPPGMRPCTKRVQRAQPHAHIAAVVVGGRLRHLPCMKPCLPLRNHCVSSIRPWAPPRRLRQTALWRWRPRPAPRPPPSRCCAAACPCAAWPRGCPAPPATAWRGLRAPSEQRGAVRAAGVRQCSAAAAAAAAARGPAREPRTCQHQGSQRCDLGRLRGRLLPLRQRLLLLRLLGRDARRWHQLRVDVADLGHVVLAAHVVLARVAVAAVEAAVERGHRRVSHGRSLAAPGRDGARWKVPCVRSARPGAGAGAVRAATDRLPRARRRPVGESVAFQLGVRLQQRTAFGQRLSAGRGELRPGQAGAGCWPGQAGARGSGRRTCSLTHTPPTNPAATPNDQAPRTHTPTPTDASPPPPVTAGSSRATPAPP
jgi:hypothetical protein